MFQGAHAAADTSGGGCRQIHRHRKWYGNLTAEDIEESVKVRIIQEIGAGPTHDSARHGAPFDKGEYVVAAAAVDCARHIASFHDKPVHPAAAGQIVHVVELDGVGSLRECAAIGGLDVPGALRVGPDERIDPRAAVDDTRERAAGTDSESVCPGAAGQILHSPEGDGVIQCPYLGAGKTPGVVL